MNSALIVTVNVEVLTNSKSFSNFKAFHFAKKIVYFFFQYWAQQIIKQEL